MARKDSLRLALITLCCSLFNLAAVAQIALVDPMGRPIQAKQYVDVKGSAYLHDEWRPGSVTVANGTKYEGVDLMYDQIEEQLLFKNKAGQVQLFTDPVVKFSIQGKEFRRGYKPVDGATPMAFYEVLVDGKTQLLKRTSKSVFEELPYGSATKVKTIQGNESFYISKGETELIKIRKDKKAVLSALEDKKAELETYIKSNRLDLRQDVDMAKLVAYYNSL